MLSGTILVFYVIVEINPLVVDMTLDTNLLTNACLYSYYWDYKLHIFLYPKSFNISYNIFYRFKPISLYGTNNIVYCMPFNIIHTYILFKSIYLGLMHTFFALEDEYGFQISTDKDGRPCISLDENHQAYDQIAPMLFAWLSQYSKLKQVEISEDEYDNWRYNFPNIEPTTGYVKNAVSDKLDAELQDTLSEEMKKRGLL